MFRSLGAGGEPIATLRALRAPDYSILLQSGGPMFLPRRYRSFHVIGVALAPEYPIVRSIGTERHAARLALGDVSLHPAGPGEHIMWPEGAACLYIHLRPGFVAARAGVRPGAGRVTIETHRRARDGVIHDIGMAILATITAPDEGGERAGRALIEALADHLASRYLAPAPPPFVLGRRTLEDVLDELRAGEPGMGTMTELARSCGLTRAHFTRRFKAATDVSPHSLVLGSRVERAKHLLATRERSISEAAYESGFTDQSHLSHAFSRLVGMTPARFRAFHSRTFHRLRSTILQDRG
jgi:AraC-like DNA-binding protein